MPYNDFFGSVSRELRKKVLYTCRHFTNEFVNCLLKHLVSFLDVHIVFFSYHCRCLVYICFNTHTHTYIIRSTFCIYGSALLMVSFEPRNHFSRKFINKGKNPSHGLIAHKLDDRHYVLVYKYEISMSQLFTQTIN